MAAARPAAPPKSYDFFVSTPLSEAKESQHCIEFAKHARLIPLPVIFARILQNNHDGEAWNILWARIYNATMDDADQAGEWFRQNASKVFSARSTGAREWNVAGHKPQFYSLLGIVKKFFHLKYDNHFLDGNSPPNKYFNCAKKLGDILGELLYVEDGMECTQRMLYKWKVIPREKYIDAMHLEVVACCQKVNALEKPAFHYRHRLHLLLNLWNDAIFQNHLNDDEKNNTDIAISNQKRISIKVSALVDGFSLRDDPSNFPIFSRSKAKWGGHNEALGIGSHLLEKRKATSLEVEEARDWLIPLITERSTPGGIASRAARLLLEHCYVSLNNEILARCVFWLKNRELANNRLRSRGITIGMDAFLIAQCRSNPVLICMAAAVMDPNTKLISSVAKKLNRYAAQFPEEFILCVRNFSVKGFQNLMILLKASTKKVLRNCLQPDPWLVKERVAWALGTFTLFPPVLIPLVTDCVRSRFYVPKDFLDLLNQPEPEIKSKAQCRIG